MKNCFKKSYIIYYLFPQECQIENSIGDYCYSNTSLCGAKLVALFHHHPNRVRTFLKPPNNPNIYLDREVRVSETLMSTKDRDLQMVVAEERGTLALPPKPPASSGSSALVEYTPPVFKEEEEDLEIKLRRILEHVPVRVSNTSGSSAGSGSGDFHQVPNSYPS